MADIYEIFMYNTDGEKQILLGGWSYLEFSQRVNAPWNHFIRYECSYEDEIASFFRTTLSTDWPVRVYRTDPVDNSKSLVYEGLSRTVVDQAKGSGILLFSLYGSGYTELLTRSLVLPPAGYDASLKSGPAETVMKEYVDEQMVNPTDTDRTRSGLSVETDQARGNDAYYSARYVNLFTAIQNVAEQGQVDFGIVGSDDDNPALFEFQVRPLWGTDRRDNNFPGNEVVLFDMFFGNMTIPILSISSADEKNFVYVGGSGDGVSRIIETMQREVGVDLSPWNRREDFVEARQENTTQGLRTVGRAILEKYRHKQALTFNIIQTDGTRWIRDWNLGDLVTARYFDYEFSKKIEQVTVQVSAGATGQIEVVSIEMADVAVFDWHLGSVGYSELGINTYLS